MRSKPLKPMRSVISRANSRRCATILVVVGLLATSRFSDAADYAEMVKLYREGKYAECIDATAKEISETAFDENYRLLKIRAEMQIGHYADALKTLEPAMKRYPASIQFRWLARDVFRFNNQPENALAQEKEIPEIVKQSTWRYSDASNQIVIAKYLLSQQADAKKVLTAVFNEIKKRQPTNIEAWQGAGQVALDKHDFALAAESFLQAVKLDPTDPDNHFGVAQAFAPSDTKREMAAIKAALAINPNHVDSLLLIVDEQIDSEQYETAEKVLDQVTKVNPQHPRGLAYRATIAHLRNQTEQEKQFRDAALQHWQTNPEVDHIIGKKLAQKYRFAEGAAYQRQAIAFDAKYLPAKMQLAQDLLRLGKEEEGWKLADEVNKEDAYDIVAHNLVTLQDAISKFRTLEQDGFVLRMDAREAEIYGPRVLKLLARAKQSLTAKYDIQIGQPIVVEMFPKQQDFAIRTFGMPGGAGFLGVCFGTVITANSPASQGETPACWEATLWHEFCHVVTLNKTQNKMPRWLSEGISVFEETTENPAWGQAINPKYREMLLSDTLTPMSQLSGAFLNPESPLHLQFAYFESALAVEFIVKKLGHDALKRILVDLAVGMPINESIARYGGSLEVLDREFAEFAKQRANEMGTKVDWSKPEFEGRPNVKTVREWIDKHPNNYVGSMTLAKLLAGDKKWSEVIALLEPLRELYPNDSGSEGILVQLSEAYRSLNDTEKERAVLEKLCELAADKLDALERLTELTSEKGEWELTKRYAEKWLAINPLRPAPHRIAAKAGEQLHDSALAAESYQALLLQDPLDPSQLHLQLARTLRESKDLAKAKRHLLMAIEETPRYRAAHQLLLEVVRELEAKKETDPSTKPDVSSPKESR